MIEWVIGAGCLWLFYLAQKERNRPFMRQIHAEVRVDELADRCEVMVVNDYGVPITANFDWKRVENLRPQEPLPRTLVIPPVHEVCVARLWHDGPHPKVSVDWAWVYGSAEALPDHRHVYRLPYREGESYRVSQGPGGSFSHTGDSHHAIDFDMPEGTPVLAARGGLVADVENQFRGRGLDRNVGGNYVMVLHSDGTVGEYFHLKFGGVKVRPGQQVEAGEFLGYSGNTGFSNGPHLHFMVFKALDGRRRQSIPIKFQLQSGVAGLIEGQAYQS